MQVQAAPIRKLGQKLKEDIQSILFEQLFRQRKYPKRTIKLVKTDIDPSGAAGGGYLTKIRFKDGHERVLSHSGNMFFIERDRFTYRMEYEEAVKMGQIAACILQCNQDKLGILQIVGTVVSMNSALSGRSSSCTVRDDKNVLRDFYTGDASIIDSTGHGWMILHEKDEVKIYYKSERPLEKELLSASIVFIKRTPN